MKPCTVCGRDVTGTGHTEVRSPQYRWNLGSYPKVTYYCHDCHAKRFSGGTHADHSETGKARQGAHA